MKSPHTSATPGKRVRVVLRDGTVIIDKFRERTGQFVVLACRRLRGREIKSMTYYRQPPDRVGVV